MHSTRVKGGGFALRLNIEERALVARLLDELAALLTEPVDPSMTERLFPVVHPDHPELESEYQRLMRDELVTSRLAGIAMVKEVLAGGQAGTARRSRSTRTSWWRSCRRSTGCASCSARSSRSPTTMRISPTNALVPEYQLYAYLSWVLDSAVHALSGI